jgi:hypothetical protein
MTLRAEHQSNLVCETRCFARLTGPFSAVSHDPNQPYNQAILIDQKRAFHGLDTILFTVTQLSSAAAETAASLIDSLTQSLIQNQRFTSADARGHCDVAEGIELSSKCGEARPIFLASYSQKMP